MLGNSVIRLTIHTVKELATKCIAKVDSERFEAVKVARNNFMYKEALKSMPEEEREKLFIRTYEYSRARNVYSESYKLANKILRSEDFLCNAFIYMTLNDLDALTNIL
jgi:hypothetical protein